MTRVTGSGNVVIESRSVSEFSGLVVNGAGRVFIDQTGTESLTITTDDNFLPYIETQVRDGKLMIEFKPKVVPNNLKDLTFRLTVKDLNSIELNGAVALEGRGIEASQMAVTISGAGAVKLTGKVDQLSVTLSGTGAHNSENLECKRAMVTNNGAGAAIVRVSDELNATINGIGFIEYIGNPKLTKGVHGLGVVSQR
ncbi:MAG: DUF2807 domain-containing protein [Chloroflexi bacterium]|nr:DUF2807 domain-containing protein [Chloroflexota bacterium]